MTEAPQFNTSPSEDPARLAGRRLAVPHQPGNRQRIEALLLVLFIKSVTATVRFRLRDDSGFFDAATAGQAIYSCWHNRLALCLPAYSFRGVGSIGGSTGEGILQPPGEPGPVGDDAVG